MERLKAILADKILEISSESEADVKAQLDKIRAFKDFATACEALMRLYPKLEEELIRMVENNDFNTRVASSRINFLISNSIEESESLKERNSAEMDPEEPDRISDDTNQDYSEEEKLQMEVATLIQPSAQISNPSDEDLSSDASIAVLESKDNDTPQDESAEQDVVSGQTQEEERGATQNILRIIIFVILGALALFLLVQFWKQVLIISLVLVVGMAGYKLWQKKKNNRS